jgi:lysophospholipase L1-like esterase
LFDNNQSIVYDAIQYAKEYIVYIDIYKIFRDKYDKLDLKYAAPDGLHLNDLGYNTWIELLQKNKYL